MGALRKSFVLAMTGRCQRCSGTGQAAQYMQGAEVLRRGRLVAVTDMTAYGRCRDCGGTGKAR